MMCCAHVHEQRDLLICVVQMNIKTMHARQQAIFIVRSSPIQEKAILCSVHNKFQLRTAV